MTMRRYYSSNETSIDDIDNIPSKDSRALQQKKGVSHEPRPHTQ